ncbi:MAG: TlpA family protein disulfide reductase [Sedimentisphaerales bacterium]|nr:TlpA family protein disulfide reductase [Sedimentisphaerales bacterium]
MKKLFCSILVLMFIASGCKKSKTEPADKAKPAPNFTLKDINGNNISLADYRGKVVILDFWATWCPPCIKEIPDFVELYEQYKDKGFAMIGISLDQAGVDVVKEFAQRFKINYPIVMNDGRVNETYGGITSIPTTFVIDSMGNIRKRYVGYIQKAVFEADIKTLLAEIK